MCLLSLRSALGRLGPLKLDSRVRFTGARGVKPVLGFFTELEITFMTGAPRSMTVKHCAVRAARVQLLAAESSESQWWSADQGCAGREDRDERGPLLQ